VILGLGGVGCPATLGLARSTDATLVLVDSDRVDVANLHRQILYTEEDAGRPKVEAAAKRLAASFPGVRIETHMTRFTEESAPFLLRRADVVVDGTDNFDSRFLANDACVELGVPLVHAAVIGWTCQIMTVLPGQTACYRCLFDGPPPPGAVPTCARAGVLGPVAGVVGALAAAEATRLVNGHPPALAGKILIHDAREGGFSPVTIRPNPDCEICDAAAREAG